MWSQSDRNTMTLKCLTDYGWKLEDDTLSVIWDSEENMSAVQERVAMLLRGCKCATGCTTRRCSCLKRGKHCSVGCECTNCSNGPVWQEIGGSDFTEVTIDEYIETDAGEGTDTEDIMDWVFREEGEHTDGRDQP